MSFHVDDDIKLFEKYKTIWNKIESLQNIKLDNFKKNFMVQKKKKKKKKIGRLIFIIYLNKN